MKKIILLSIAVTGFGLFPAQAMTSRVGSAQDFGVGPALGQPMGATGKYWLSSTTAVDAFAGYHFHSNFDLHADYLWHSFSSFSISQGRMPFYFGVGARINAGDDTHFGFRLPLGLSYLSSSDPLEFFTEIAPVIKVTDGVSATVDGMIGVRLYLNYVK